MTGRPTLRRNGRTMVDVRVTFPVGGAEIACALSRWQTISGELNLATITRKQVSEVVSRGIYIEGKMSYDYPGPTDNQVVHDAVAAVRRLWPELDDDELRQLLTLYPADGDDAPDD